MRLYIYCNKMYCGISRWCYFFEVTEIVVFRCFAKTRDAMHRVSTVGIKFISPLPRRRSCNLLTGITGGQLSLYHVYIYCMAHSVCTLLAAGNCSFAALPYFLADRPTLQVNWYHGRWSFQFT